MHINEQSLSAPIFYTYIYLDPRKPGVFIYDDLEFLYEPFYVGRGRGTRIDQHIRLALRSKKKFYHLNKIRAIFQDGLEPIRFKLKENLTSDESSQHEIELISKIGRRDTGHGPLTNLTAGGDGAVNMSNETRTKISQYRKGRKLSIEHRKAISRGGKGKTLTAYQKEMLSLSHKGKPLSDEHRRKISQTKKGKYLGRKLSEETKEKIRQSNIRTKAEQRRRHMEEDPTWSPIYVKKGRPEKLSDEHRKAISEGLTGRTFSDEHCQNLSSAQKGKTLSEEHKRKIGQASLGHTLSEESRKKIGDKHRGKTVSEESRKKISNSLKGTHLSEETKEKLSKALKGKPQKKRSDETRKRMSESRKGKTLSEEHKRKIGDKLKGGKRSEETKRKMREAWERRKSQ